MANLISIAYSSMERHSYACMQMGAVQIKSGADIAEQSTNVSRLMWLWSNLSDSSCRSNDKTTHTQMEQAFSQVSPIQKCKYFL